MVKGVHWLMPMRDINNTQPLRPKINTILFAEVMAIVIRTSMMLRAIHLIEMIKFVTITGKANDPTHTYLL